MKFFNAAGPCRPALHCLLPAAEWLEEFRLDLLGVQEACFVLHAPRQTGKTIIMMEWGCPMTVAGQHICACVALPTGPHAMDCRHATATNMPLHVVSARNRPFLQMARPHFPSEVFP